ncbi:hypothetical protein G9A89_019984 [Geosiphon pyriformis]|nr:hypothetical protein G9A89_019984 [Geosiphon pyriformis]
MNLQPTDIYNIQKKRPKTSGNICNNKFKVATTPDTTTLRYHQSIYTHCKQRFNIPDGIEVVKKLVYQYIENHINNYLFGNYNISEVRSNLYNNLVYYSQLGTENLNSKTLATYFQELNFNIIEYCEEKYPVQPKYSFNFESKTETSNKDKQKVKQYSRTTPNTPILPKTTAKHFIKLALSITPFPILLVQPQTPSLPLNCFSKPEDFQSLRNPTQQQKPISTSANIINYLQKNENNHSESLESEETKSKPEEITRNKEEMATAYIAKIPEFTGEDNNTTEDANGWIAARMLKAIPYFLQGTAEEWFENLEEPFENWQAFKDAFLQQFTDNNTSITLHNRFCNIKQETSKTIQQTSSTNYEMTMEEANHTKLINLAIGKTTTSQTNNNSNNNHKDINSYNNTTKTILDHHPTTNLKIVIIVEFQNTRNEIVENYKETNKTEVINVTFHYNNLITNFHYQPIIYQDHKIKTVTINQLHNQCSNNISNLYQFIPAKKLVQHNQFTPQNQFQNNNNRINLNNQPNYYHTQPSYLTIPEKSDFQQPALSEGKVVAPRSNLSNNTISPAQIAQNANLLNIFSFEFEANESPFLLSNAAANEQRAITVMYTKATVEGKPIQLILDSELAGSIITYQLIQQLQRTVDRPAQTVIVTADGMKKTPVGEIDNFSFTINGITISVKVLVIDAPQYQALVGNNWLFKANTNLDWETQELKISYQGQYTIVPVTCEKAPVFEFEEEKEMPLTEIYMALGSTSNWAEETEQEIFEESRKWKKKQPPYISLKCKDYNKKLSLIDMLPEEYNWIDIAIREGVCDQTFRRGTPFDAAYNSALNKLYHYPHDTEMIFDLAMTLINRATQEDVHQMKEAEYIEYTMKLAGVDYKNEVETYHQIASHTYPTQEA